MSAGTTYKAKFKMHSFYWNDHSNNVMKNFANLYEKKLFVDCSLNVEGQSIEAHKNILSSFSPFFEHVFTELPHKRNFVLEDVKFQDVKSALDLIYHGRTEISQSRMQSFLDLVEILELPDEALKLTGDKNQKEGSGQEPGPGTSDVDRIKLKENGSSLKLSEDSNIVGCELDLPVINTDNSEDHSWVEIESLSSLISQFTKRGVNKVKSSHDDGLAKKRGLCLKDILRRSCGDLEINGSSSISKLKRNSDGEILLEDLESCESDDDNAGISPSKKNKRSSKHNYDKPDSQNGERFEPRDVASMKSTLPEILDLLEDFKKENRNLTKQIIENQGVIMYMVSEKKGKGLGIDPKNDMKSYNLKFPMETLEEYHRFSKLLEDDAIFRESVSIMLSRSLDKNHIIPKSIVSMLKTLMVKDLAHSFCASKSTDTKLKMKDSPIYNVMLALVMSKRKIANMETPDKDFNRYLSAVLTNVHKWNVKRKKD